MGLFKDSAKVFTGATLQRIISLAMIPVVARLVGPDDYGIFQAALSFCVLLFVVGSFSIEATIAVADSSEKAALRTIATILVGIISSILFWFGVTVFKPLLLKLFSPEIIKGISIMIPIFIPLTISSKAFQNYAGYRGKFTYFAIADVSYSLANFIVFALSYFFLWRDYRALIAGTAIALCVKIAVLSYSINIFHIFTSRINYIDFLKEIRSVFDYVKFYFPSNIINVYSAELPVLLLALVFSEKVVGLFVMARSLIMIPAALCSIAIGKVFYPKAADKYRQSGQLTSITWQSFQYGNMFSIFPTLFVAASSFSILPTLLGEKWLGAAPYMLLLLPMVIFKAIETQIGIGFIFSILNQIRKILLGNSFLFICRFFPFLVSLFVIPSPYWVVFVFSLGSAFGYAGLLLWIFRSVNIPLRKAGFSMLQYFIWSGVCVLPVFLTFLYQKIYFLSLCLLLSFTVYGAVVWFVFFDKNKRDDISAKTRYWLQLQNAGPPIIKQ